jgi:site-specific recombinase XerC
MAKKRDRSKEVQQARRVLDKERDAVLHALEEAGAELKEHAKRQAAWRAKVDELLIRGRTAGVPVSGMARALGVSRQWTSHLLAERVKAKTPLASLQQGPWGYVMGPPTRPPEGEAETPR